MDDFHRNLEQFYPMKAVMGELLGKDCFGKLKETGDLATWKQESLRLLKAARIAIETSVEVADNEWREEIASILDLGRSHINAAHTAADIFCALASTFSRMSFHQLGMMPKRSALARVTLTQHYWRLNGYRSVQYVQTAEQQQALKRSKRRQTKSEI